VARIGKTRDVYETFFGIGMEETTQKHKRRWRIILKRILEKREVCCLKTISVSKIMGKWWNGVDSGNRSTQGEVSSHATLSTPSPTNTGLGSNREMLEI
jgi:hypothetical protein